MRKSKRQLTKQASILVNGDTYKVSKGGINQGIEWYEITGLNCPLFTFSYCRVVGKWAATVNSTPDRGDARFRFSTVEEAISWMIKR